MCMPFHVCEYCVRVSEYLLFPRESLFYCKCVYLSEHVNEYVCASEIFLPVRWSQLQELSFDCKYSLPLKELFCVYVCECVCLVFQ